ncbi:hypothetical protein CAP2UW1_2437 [Candidatus Accumulibacter phosphatis]|jgi:hypothetical protein|uniref:Uncharacterized protein n=1 Tax=Accumulibacter regalis TaxID=522306 RepID=C7RR45_ACCRE
MYIARVHISQDDAKAIVATTCASSREALLNEESHCGFAVRRAPGYPESPAGYCSAPSSR